MRLDTYDFAFGPSRGVSAPRRQGRILVDRTYGGIVVHTAPGHMGDDVISLPWTLLKAWPSETLLQTEPATAVVVDTIISNQAMGAQVPVLAGAFAGVSAVQMTLRRDAPGAGLLSVEVWDMTATLPIRKVGVLGVIDVETDLAVGWQEITIWSDVAWPLLPPGGWVVLNGVGLTAGTVSWAGDPAPVNAHAEYVAYPGLSEGGLNPVTDMTGHLLEVDMNVAVDGGAATPVVFAWAGKNTGALIAAEMQAKIQALGGAFGAVTVTYEHAPIVDHYLITSGTTGYGSAVVVTSGGANSCTDELELGVADGGTETPGGWLWQLANGEPSMTAWQGSQFYVLRGMAAAYCYPGGIGPQTRVFEDEDSHRYSVIAAEMPQAQYRIKPGTRDDRGLVGGVRLLLQVIGETGDQGLVAP